MAKPTVQTALWRRRWGFETRLWLAGVSLCGLLMFLLGVSRGEFTFAFILLVAVCTSAGLRNEVGRRLLQRHRLRPMQKVVDLTLGEMSPELYRRRTTAVGETVTCRLNRGSSGLRLAREADLLAASLGVREVRVHPHREDQSRVDLLVVRHETLEQPIRPDVVFSRYRPSLHGCLPLGIDEDGDDVVLGLVGHHLLIGGEPGAGKSGSLSVVLAAGALDPDCDMWCFDGKLVELAAWRPVAARVVGADMAEANETLDELRAEMDRRYARLLGLGKRKVEAGDGERTLLVVVDELAFYVANGDKKAAQGFSERLRDVVARARAAGIVVVAATQKPSADLIPSGLRDNFGYRLAHRCSTREASDTILGSGWAAEGISASFIDPRLRGVGYLLAEGGIPRRMRSVHLDDDAIAGVVARVISLRSTA